MKIAKTGPETRRLITWFSSIFRWILGIVFAGAGIIHLNKGGWPAILFGALIFITGFFRPIRCLNDGCELPPGKANENK